MEENNDNEEKEEEEEEEEEETGKMGILYSRTRSSCNSLFGGERKREGGKG